MHRLHSIFGDKTFTTIDYLEQPGKLKENVRDNLFNPLTSAFVFKQEIGIYFTYLGTGCMMLVALGN